MGRGLSRGLLAAALVAAQLASLPLRADAAPPGFAPGRTTRVSVSSLGAPANASILFGSIAVGGRYVTFASSATNLVPGATTFEVYRRDRLTGATLLVSVDSTGAPLAGGAFGNFASADGRYVVFDSGDATLAENDTNGALDVFVRDMETGTTRLVSANAAGVIADRGGVLPRTIGPRGISDDGRYVLFGSFATNLVPGPVNSFAHVYVKDLVTGAVARASVDSAGNPGNDNSSIPTLSGNGRVVAFRSEASNFSPLSTGHNSQVFVHDFGTGLTTLESVTSAGLPNTFFAATSPSLSYDGRFLAFETQASLEPRDLDSFTWDVYLRDRAAGTTVIASRSATTATFVDSRSPTISDDGRFVAFSSIDGGIVPGDTNNKSDVYLFDRVTEGITLVTLNDAGLQANGGSSSPSVSGDGNLVLFLSTATNLVTSPPSTGGQLYVRDFVTNTAPTVTLPATVVATVGSDLVLAGSFTDPDAGQTWSATVAFGDGTSGPLVLAADKTFVVRHTYRAKGTFALTVTVSDSAGGAGLATAIVTAKLRPLIFVPGLLGSEIEAKANGSITLVESDGTTRTRNYETGDILWPHFTSPPDVLTPVFDPEYYDLLRLDDHADPLIPSGPNGRLYTADQGYAEVEPFLAAQGYVKDHDLFVVGWDWRFTPESQVGYLSTAVARALIETGADSVDIIAHSQGTFLTRAFLQTSVYRSNVAHVVLAGMPNFGAPKAVDALLYGQCVQQLGPFCALRPQTTRYVLRTMPGVVSDSVSPAYYEFFQNQTAPGDFRPIPYFVVPAGPDDPIPPEQFTYTFLRGVLVERGVPESVLSTAEAFHQNDTTWLGDVLRNTGAKIALAAGSGQCAYGQVRVTTRAEISRDLFGRITVKTRTALDYVTIDGDTIVPRQSAVEGTGLAADFASGLPATDRLLTYVRDLQHGQLVDHNGLPDALRFIHDLPVDPGTIQNPDCPVLSVHSPAELVVTDVAGRRTGGTGDDQAQLIEIPDAVYDRFDDMKVVRFGHDAVYTATLTGTGDGEATVRMRWIEGTTTREAMFLHIPTTAHSRGTLTIDTATRAVSPLALDLDGDGVIDRTISPTILLGTAASDTMPPALSSVSPHLGQAVVGSFPVSWVTSDAQSGIETSFAVVDRAVGGEIFIAQSGDQVQLTPGAHQLQVFSEDRAGNVSERHSVIVADGYTWLTPIDSDGAIAGRAGRTIPVKFSVTTATGASVRDTSVLVDVLDRTGRVVSGPVSVANDPADGVVIQGDIYHANVSTAGLSPGSYSLRVHFGSPTLVGQFMATVILR